MVGAWVPGSSRFKAPAGMGVKLAANTNIVMQLHYPAGTYNQTDSTEVRIKYRRAALPARWPLTRPSTHFGSLTNSPLVIPANTTQNVPCRIPGTRAVRRYRTACRSACT